MFRRKKREISLDIITSMCTGCGKCADKCRSHAIWIKHIDDRSFAWLASPEECTGCGKCAKVCDFSAIIITPLDESAALPTF